MRRVYRRCKNSVIVKQIYTNGYKYSKKPQRKKKQTPYRRENCKKNHVFWFNKWKTIVSQLNGLLLQYQIFDPIFNFHIFLFFFIYYCILIFIYELLECYSNQIIYNYMEKFHLLNCGLKWSYWNFHSKKN